MDDDIERSTVGAMMARSGGMCLRGGAALCAVLWRRPIDSLGILVATAAAGLVLANALFLQVAPHPAPMMAVKPRPVASDVTSSLPARPVTPAPVARHTDSIAPRTEVVRTEAIKPVAIRSEAIKTDLKTDAAVPAATPAARTRGQIVSDIQRELSRRGFFEGTVDGVYGPKTDTAIRDFAHAAGLKGDHQPDDTLLRLIARSHAHAAPSPAPANAVTPPPARPAATTPARAAAPARTAAPMRLEPPAPVHTTASIDVPRPPAPIRTAASAAAPSKRIVGVQRALSDFGYGQVAPTGVMGAETKSAIERFERERKLPVTGQVSDRLVRELAAVTGRPLE
jgi:peptidoglycan hydrolase-like protein with peptidoglycan-binding domain